MQHYLYHHDTICPLIPIDTFQSGFSACPSLTRTNVEIVSLEDEALGVHKVTSRNGTKHTLVVPPPAAITRPDVMIPDPPLAWEAFYPKGSINPTAPIPGGFGFYLAGPP